VRDRRSASYWQKKLGGMDYSEEDKLDTPRFNLELWKGMMGNKPYPTERSGKDLRENRKELLAKYGIKIALTRRSDAADTAAGVSRGVHEGVTNRE